MAVSRVAADVVRDPNLGLFKMAIIEELELEENPGEDLLLEENPGEGDSATGGEWNPTLEDNQPGPHGNGDDDEDEEEWEIPFAMDAGAPTETAEIVDVRIARKGNERLGLVLDEANVIVALREDTQAAASGNLFIGDTVLAVQGVACSLEKRVAQLLRELPDAATYAFTVRRALDVSPPDVSSMRLSEQVADHGPLLTPEEQAQYSQRELETRQKMREQLEQLPEGDEARQALSKELAPRNLTESKCAPSPRIPCRSCPPC